MNNYCIVAAKPKGAVNHVHSQFLLYKEIKTATTVTWSKIGWHTINQVSDLLRNGDNVRTAELSADKGSLKFGDAVELELRIQHNGTKYKLSTMPDQ